MASFETLYCVKECGQEVSTTGGEEECGQEVSTTGGEEVVDKRLCVIVKTTTDYSTHLLGHAAHAAEARSKAHPPTLSFSTALLVSIRWHRRHREMAERREEHDPSVQGSA